MNERFKFRVWDDTIGAYWKEGTIQLSGNGQPFIIDGNMQPQDIENVIIEQCTGLKDKNGKLIFEGDVISRNNGLWKEIRFYQGGFGWWTEYDCFVSFSGHNHLEEILQTHEIIGNIHEKEQNK